MINQFRISPKTFAGLFIVGLWAIILVSPAMAQFSSVFEGTVTDQSGATVPNAKIVVTNQATNVNYEGTSTSTGTFRIPALPAGSYRIEVRAVGFKIWTQTDLIVEPNKVRTVNPDLVLGAQLTTVEVQAKATSVETGKSEATRTVSTTSISDAPMPLRNIYVSLAAYAPGVTGTGVDMGNTATATPDNFGTEVDPNINAAGKRYEMNFYYVDGSPVNVVSMGGTIVIQPEPDTVSEMKITAVDFSADVGRGSGAIVQVFTKSGTNQFHGNLSEFHTDNDLTSRTVFQTGSLPATRRNEFGGTIGGPIFKNRTFFFGSLFFMRSSRVDTIVTPVETPNFTSFVASNFPNSIAAATFAIDPPKVPPTQDILTVAQVEAQTPGYFPATAFPATLPAVGTAYINNVIPRNGDQWHFRFDHNFNSDKDRIYLSNYNSTGTDAFDNPRPASWMPTREVSWLPKLDWVHTISPTLLNEASITYLRTTGAFNTYLPNLPTDYPTGIASLGMWGGLPWAENDFNWHDTISWMHGSHNIRVGLDVDRQKDDDQYTYIDKRPSFSFANLLDFAQDKPYAQSGPTVYTPTEGTAYDYELERVFYMGPFIQDDWKVTRRVTLNLGLRYDYFGHLACLTNNHVPIPKWAPGEGSTFAEQITNGSMKTYGGGYQVPDRVMGFAPRIGFGWDVFGNGSTAIRAGYGIFYDRYGEQAYRAETNPPLWASPSVSIFERGAELSYMLGPNFLPPPGFSAQANPAGGIEGTLVAAQGVQPNISPPTTHQWMASVQHTVGHDLLIEGDYYGVHAVDLEMMTNVNRFPGDLVVNNGVLKRLNPYFGSVQYSYGVGPADSHYASLMVNKRYSRSWSLTGIFTLGKATDDNSSFGTGAANSGNIVNALNPNSQHGRADFSVGKRLSLDSTFMVPELWGGRGLKSKLLSGWRLEEVGILQGGLPYPVYCSAPFVPVYQTPGDSSTPIVGNAGCDYNADGFDYDFPNTPAFGNHKSGNRSAFLTGIFTASQFPAPPLGQEGNLGRNTFNGPGLANFNTEFAKATRVPWFTHEGASLEFRADIFNLFNRVNLGLPVSDLASSQFGYSTSQQMPRTVQFGLYIRY
jgi:hypothetical protein